jgi:transposase, IS30 family
MPYHHLTPAERLVITSMRRAGISQAAIAHALSRNPGTISRELRRNRDTVGDCYDAHWANIQYWERRKQVVNAHKTGDAVLMKYVLAKLELRWSPEQIAGRLRHVEQAQSPVKWVSFQTIYRYVAHNKRRGGTLYRFLRRGRKPFGKRGAGRHPNTWIKGRVSIDERPAIVEEQGRIGDWEGDTFYGAKRRSCLATLVERKSLYLVAQKMPNATAQALNEAFLKGLGKVQKALVHTITVDNGKEFVGFKTIEETLEATVFFAHPYHAWERGINENTNGLLRQFIPRKTDFSAMTPEELDRIVQYLNNRPRKKLQYRTPNEAFHEATVALAM